MPQQPNIGLLRAGFVGTAGEAPIAPGAYLLLLTMAAPVSIVLPGRAPVTLPPGRYLYAGSARGPGGVRARLARHMRTDKRPHWHIDQLTCTAAVDGAWVLPGGEECAIVAALSHLRAPIAGFGSSDCRTCISHLLAWPDVPLATVPGR